MTWHCPTTVAPATLWAIGEKVTWTHWNDTTGQGIVKEHFSAYSLICTIGETQTLVPTGNLLDAAERVANHLADLALG